MLHALNLRPFIHVVVINNGSVERDRALGLCLEFLILTSRGIRSYDRSQRLTPGRRTKYDKFYVVSKVFSKSFPT